MSRKRSSVTDSWTLSRCKRIVRPFLSKIHSLSDHCSKDASLLAFKYVAEKSDLPANKAPNPHKRRSTGTKTAREDDSQTLDDLDYVENGFVADDSDLSTQDLALNRFLKPATAQERLEALKPLIHPKLYSAYTEIFSSFKSIIVSIELTRDQKAFPKLSDSCCFEIGKAMVLTSKTSYHKLNQILLFDPETVPDDIKLYHKHLSDDIDQWFELQPQSIFEKYTVELLIGYITHLVLFHSHSTLYLLVPVLIHWLYEESIVISSPNLKVLSNKLFYGWWLYDSEKYYDNLATHAVASLTGLKSSSNDIFWTLFEIGFWDNFISSFGFQSDQQNNHYDHLMIKTLICNEKIDSLDETRFFKVLDESVYPLVERAPANANINQLLILVFARLVHLGLSSVPAKDMIKHTKKFVEVWLAFEMDRSMVFNSLYPGNEELFRGVVQVAAYLKAESLHQTLVLLRGFFLEQEVSCDADLSDTVLSLQTESFRDLVPFKYHNRDVNEFLYWLVDVNFVMAQRLFAKVYGSYSTFYDPEIDDLYSILHRT